MNYFVQLAIAATTVVIITPNLSTIAFETEDFDQLKTSRICNEPCDLSEADLSEVYLVKANLINANLEGAYLNEVNLNHALLEKANLSNADLRGSYLREANLAQADLSQAKLYQADTRGVILDQANIQGARLIAVNNLTATQIKSACNWEEAIYEENDDANQQFISNLRQDLDSAPEQPVDCSIWE